MYCHAGLPLPVPLPLSSALSVAPGLPCNDASVVPLRVRVHNTAHLASPSPWPPARHRRGVCGTLRCAGGIHETPGEVLVVPPLAVLLGLLAPLVRLGVTGLGPGSGLSGGSIWRLNRSVRRNSCKSFLPPS